MMGDVVQQPLHSQRMIGCRTPPNHSSLDFPIHDYKLRFFLLIIIVVIFKYFFSVFFKLL